MTPRGRHLPTISGWTTRLPIEAVTAAATAIGGGQLHLVVPAGSRDEVGRLAEASKAMAEKLRAYCRANRERLGRAQRAAQATIDSFPDPVVVLDTLGRVQTANPAAQTLLGVRPPPKARPPHRGRRRTHCARPCATRSKPNDLR